MYKLFSPMKRAYIAGFLDGDGSIYVRAKPNKTYRYGFQVAPYIVLYQSKKDRENFEQVCSFIGLGYIRERKDGILEYIISKIDNIQKFLKYVQPYVVMKKAQIDLMVKILKVKNMVQNENDFKLLLELVDHFRDLNYSKKRLKRTLTP